MKSIVIYFSQTGNTEMVAKAIKNGIMKTTGHCDIAKIKDVNPRRLYEYDLIGLGCPVFDFVEPANVSLFINNMRFVGGKHVFAFSTHGAHGEMFSASIIPKLKRRGLIVLGARDWYANCYLLYMPNPYPTDGHPDEIDLVEAEEFGKEMAENSRSVSAGNNSLFLDLKTTRLSLPNREKDFGSSKVDGLAKAMVKFHQEKCKYPECRLCMDNCPMDGIDLSIEPPVIAKPCSKCEFCVKICPTGALEADDFLKAMAAMHPKKFTELIVKPLEEAEKEGHFRRLISADKINYNIPIFKSHPRHPQWIIGKGLQ